MRMTLMTMTPRTPQNQSLIQNQKGICYSSPIHEAHAITSEDEDDETAELMKELEKIKKEREEEARRRVRTAFVQSTYNTTHTRARSDHPRTPLPTTTAPAHHHCTSTPPLPRTPLLPP